MTIPQSIVQLNFELKLPNGPNSPFVIIAGGADIDRDGTVEDNDEYAIFARNANTWTRQQAVTGSVSGMLFYVQFTVGPNVPYDFTIKDAAGGLLFSNQNVTSGATESIRWTLS
jgi:hypothetical protein